MKGSKTFCDGQMAELFDLLCYLLDRNGDWGLEEMSSLSISLRVAQASLPAGNTFPKRSDEYPLHKIKL